MRARVVALALFLLPLLVGLAVGYAGERTAVGATLLWAEPLLIVGALYGALLLAVERWWLGAAALLTGVLGGSAALRVPAEPLPVTEVRADWSERLRECTTRLERPRASVRLLTWTRSPVQDPPMQVAQLVHERPDLVLVHGLAGPETVEELAEALGGEAKFLPGPTSDGGLGLVVRGAFRYCGGREDAWQMPLPAADRDAARAVLSFPEVVDVGVVPLVAVQLEGTGGPGSWLGWPQRLVQGSRHLAALVRALGPRRLVVAGDFAAPPSFRRVAGHMLGAGLLEVPVPATWPARLGPLPTPTLHALDRVWVGDGWTELSAKVLAGQGSQRRPLVVELAPL